MQEGGGWMQGGACCSGGPRLRLVLCACLHLLPGAASPTVTGATGGAMALHGMELAQHGMELAQHGSGSMGSTPALSAQPALLCSPQPEGGLRTEIT